jgi:hypothetical protein
VNKITKEQKAKFNRLPLEDYEIERGPDGEIQRFPTGTRRLVAQEKLVRGLPRC